jgi:hypothetical protein
MPGACDYCRGVLVEGRAAAYGLCAVCFGLLEDELADAAVRVGRPARPDAETVADIPVPDGLTAPAPPEPAPARDAASP